MADTVAWFAQRGVALKTEADGRMFPTTDCSETIARALEEPPGGPACSVLPNTAAEEINCATAGGGFRLHAERQRAAQARR
ncbi:MAG: NAD(P)/FAD-dependent oxidoreductase [Hymenobacter sp.]